MVRFSAFRFIKFMSSCPPHYKTELIYPLAKTWTLVSVLWCLMHNLMRTLTLICHSRLIGNNIIFQCDVPSGITPLRLKGIKGRSSRQSCAAMLHLIKKPLIRRKNFFSQIALWRLRDAQWAKRGVQSGRTGRVSGSLHGTCTVYASRIKHLTICSLLDEPLANLGRDLAFFRWFDGTGTYVSSHFAVAK